MTPRSPRRKWTQQQRTPPNCANTGQDLPSASPTARA
ncbi:rCG58934 [Rattus norvegicus]|uniref:RCG58934 n=1 Tax=Rattus norvegicus TaxID=10116 RepID=A6KQ83_RAT|nr:rCG58934 [Rattus norvegicus]